MKDIRLKRDVRAFYEECRRIAKCKHPMVLMYVADGDVADAQKAYGVRGIMMRLADIEKREPSALSMGVVLELGDVAADGVKECCACRYLYGGEDEHAEPSCPIDSGDDICVAETALAGKTVVITGKFESHTREAMQRLVVRAGGSLRLAVSGLTSYLVCGSADGSEKKMERARTLGVECLSEREFIELIKVKNV